MKLWFIEPRANIFVSGVKDNVANKVIEYLLSHCPLESGLLIFQQSRSTPGYKISGKGSHNREIVKINGLQLVKEVDSK